VYGEEAAYLDPEVFFQVMVPLLGVKHTSLIMISTPVNTENFYSELFNATDPETGEKLFNTFQVSLICDKCKGKQIESACRHRLQDIPSWKSAGKFKMISEIFRGREVLYKREEMGTVSDGGKPVFEKEHIESFFNHDPFVFKEQPTHVFIACDPNASSDSKTNRSQMALSACVYLHGQMTVCTSA